MFDYRGGEGEGSRIQQVSEDGPAAKAGLLAGDRILKVDGKPAGQPGHGGGINTILRPEEIGKEHKLTIRRGEEESELPITVGSRKENDYRVVELEETSEQQRALRSGWLASLQPAKARG
jgi:S1-C subfamily serine protease